MVSPVGFLLFRPSDAVVHVETIGWRLVDSGISAKPNFLPDTARPLVARCTNPASQDGLDLIEILAGSNHGDTARLGAAEIKPSVGSDGDSYDNALAETINGLFKAEVIHRPGPWRSFEAVEYATLGWVDWFNNRRLLEHIGNIPPAEAETDFYASLASEDLAA
ncbi:hypothetical protein PRI8871_00699 [Pseudoprimorskyibacter insulae]|uniref:Integrase catalytic domain-containing protein n=1 Tax=Pseudoprimorskyibacter insulae TaxID=1695997 RepID=A0A2R8APV0_9RHOB|nr:hypothetical protein PRI8871_00699 [Pseudoprimorskyibacter insulae]